jgi:hypothetical protein
MKRSHCCIWSATVLFTVACQEHRPPTSPPSYLIQDAINNSGNPHFFWLPPMTAQPSFSGTFNATAAPTVEIRELAMTGCGNSDGSDRIIATFTMTTGPGGEKVGVDVAGHQYILNWHTANFNLNVACTYRIRVLVAGLPLGLADVDVVSTGAQLKRVDTQEFVPLLDDRTLPIKFRIEDGAVFYALTGDNACRPGRDCAEAVVSPGADATILTGQQLAGVFIPAAALREQIDVVIEQRVDRPCIPTNVMSQPQFDDCYRYVAVPTAPIVIEGVTAQQATEGESNPPYRFATDVTVGMCVEVGNLTLEQQHQLQIFRFEPTPTGDIPQLAVLPDAPAAFLPCDPNFQPGGSGGGGGTIGRSGGVWGRGWQFVLRELRGVFGARPLYASSAVIHLGLGGSSCCFSYFTWGLPGSLLVRPSSSGVTAVSPVTLPLTQTSGLSMQSGTGIQLEVSPATAVTWSSSDPTGSNGSVNTTGLLAVVAGNGDPSTAHEAIITASATDFSGTGSIKVNSFNFDHFPRLTTLVWTPVTNAATYEVSVDFGNGCTTGTANCDTWSRQYLTTTSDVRLAISFVGAQPGRWQVVAKDANGNILATSGLTYFVYII